MQRPRPARHALRPVRLTALAVLAGLAGCVDVPELDRAVPGWVDDAPYPKLIPLDSRVVTQIAPQEQSQELDQQLTARGDDLKSRAAHLTAEPVLDEETRKRMAGGVSR
jgi:hypothetical protein